MLESLFNKVVGLKILQYLQTPTQVFSCKYFKSFKIEEHLRMTVSLMTKKIRWVKILAKAVCLKGFKLTKFTADSLPKNCEFGHIY